MKKEVDLKIQRFNLRGINIEMFGRSNSKQQRIVKYSYLEEMPKGCACHYKYH